MDDPSRRWEIPRLSSRDVTVTPALDGYAIGGIDREDWRLLKIAGSWDEGVRAARWYAALRGGRVWASRQGADLEPLVFQSVGLDADQTWHRYDAQTVKAHVPALPGIYVLRASGPVFIGETENLQARLLYHLEEPLPCTEAAPPIDVSFTVIESPAVRERRTAELITWWKPPCNQPM